MQLRLILNTGTGMARYVQCGSPSGFSEWEPYNRQSALIMIEFGFDFERV